MQDLTAIASSLNCRGQRTAGFTLLELALTLAIMGMLAAGILVPFVAQVAQRNITSTEKLLEQAKEALIGYATVTGRLPCPATDTSNGQESPAGAAGTGQCTAFFGFLPAVTLGFTPIDSEGYGVDAWSTRQNRIRYAVSSDGGAFTFTRTNGMKIAGPSSLNDSALIYVCGIGNGVVESGGSTGCGSAAGQVLLTDRAPVILWSLGANAATGGGSSVHEAPNQFPGAMAGGAVDRVFVSRTMNNTPGAEYDDIVTWLSVGNLVSRMVLGGQLP